MITRKSQAKWEGDLQQGSGSMRLGSGAYEGQFSFRSRFEQGTGTNPEELLAAAHAGCFSMAFSNILAEAGTPPNSVDTTASVSLDMDGEGPTITKVELNTEASVDGISQADFDQHAQAAKAGCPVSKLFTGAEITLNATLKK